MRCAEALQRAEVLGIFAGRLERRRLGLIQEAQPRRGAPPLLALAVMLALSATRGWAGTLQGRFVLPTTGSGIRNGTLTLALSQAAAVPGSFAIVPATVACYTSVDGSVVGLPNPASPPTLHAIPGTGSLPAGTYFVAFTYLGAGGETLASPEATVNLTVTGEIEVDPPALQPNGATGINVYIGAASGAELKQGTDAFTEYVQAAALTAGAAPPATNSSSCTLIFNDATVPAPTYYVATLKDANGNTIAGFPQSWYLSGAADDVSQLVPLTSNPAVRFPEPLLSNPATSAAQSVGSALNLNGFAISNTSNLGPGIISGFWSGALPPPTATLDQWTPNAALVVRRISLYAQTAGNGGSSGTSLTIGNSQGSCTFSALLPAATAASSNGAPAGACAFAAGLPLTLSITSDDHTTRPANVEWKIEATAQ
ncbi:MAG TPA: hypothetical protein VE996_08210 [Terriglobales bacterium]|nr:hypothetical protein [Terriglobales bacterium]